MPLPGGITLDMAEQPKVNPADVLTMLYYSSQIQLRKTLNRAHTVLYGRGELLWCTSGYLPLR